MSETEATAAKTDEERALEATYGEPLRRYNPADRESESEKHHPHVMPRAFLSDYGYNLDGEKIPNYLGRVLIDRLVTPDAEIATFISSHEPGSGGRFDTPEEKRDMLLRDGYTQIEVYRLDGPQDDAEEGDHPIVRENYADGGYLLRYAVSSHRDPHVADVHDHIGYYVVDDLGLNNLICILFNRHRESRHTNYEWNDPDNYSEKTWAVAHLNENTLINGGQNGDLLREHALYRDEDDDPVWVGPLNRSY